MDLNNRRMCNKAQSGQSRLAVMVPVTLAMIAGIAVASLIAALLLHGPFMKQPLPAPPIPGAGIELALLFAILVVLGGIFILLVMLLCKGGCGCGCGGEKSLLQLLAVLLPGLTAGLRAGAKAFDSAANTAHMTIAPLRATGNILQNTVGPSLQQINVPSASLPNKPLWDVLHDLHLVHGPAPDFMSSIWVLTGVTLDTSSPFAGPNGLGTQVSATGSDLVGAGDRAASLESDLRAGGRGLRAVATAIDGQP